MLKGHLEYLEYISSLIGVYAVVVYLKGDPVAVLISEIPSIHPFTPCRANTTTKVSVLWDLGHVASAAKALATTTTTSTSTTTPPIPSPVTQAP